MTAPRSSKTLVGLAILLGLAAAGGIALYTQRTRADLAATEASAAPPPSTPSAPPRNRALERLLSEGQELSERSKAVEALSRAVADGPPPRNPEALERLTRAETLSAKGAPLGEIEDLYIAALKQAGADKDGEFVKEILIELFRLLDRRDRQDRLLQFLQSSEEFVRNAENETHGPELIYLLGKARISAGEDEGFDDLKRVAKLWPKSAWGLATQAHLALCDDDYPQATRLAKQALALDSGCRIAREALAASREEEEPEEALSLYEALLESHPDALEHHIRVASLSQELGAWKKAEEHAQESLRLSEDRPLRVSLNLLYRALWEQARYDDLLQAARKVTANYSSKDFDAWLWKGAAWEGKKNPARAKEVWDYLWKKTQAEATQEWLTEHAETSSLAPLLKAIRAAKPKPKPR